MVEILFSLVKALLGMFSNPAQGDYLALNYSSDVGRSGVEKEWQGLNEEILQGKAGA